MPKCKVIGVSDRISGTSKKTGREYDFVNLHLAYDVPEIHGQAVTTQAIDTSLVPAAIAPGQVVFIDTNLQGRVVGMNIVPEEVK